MGRKECWNREHRKQTGDEGDPTLHHERGVCIPIILASGYDEGSVMSEVYAERPQVFLGKP